MEKSLDEREQPAPTLLARVRELERKGVSMETQLAQYLRHGYSVRQIATTHAVCPMTIYRWLDRYRLPRPGRRRR